MSLSTRPDPHHINRFLKTKGYPMSSTDRAKNLRSILCDEIIEGRMLATSGGQPFEADAEPNLERIHTTARNAATEGFESHEQSD